MNKKYISVSKHIPYLKQIINNNTLNKKQVKELCNILTKKKDKKNEKFYIDIFTNRINQGFNESSKIKATFLNNICHENIESPYINKEQAIKILGTMKNGYNIKPLISMLHNKDYGYHAAKALSQSTHVFDNYYTIERMCGQGNHFAQMVMESWSKAEWFFSNPVVPEKISICVFKVPGETKTEDLSSSYDYIRCNNISSHSKTMLKNPRKEIIPDLPGKIGPMNQINLLKKNNLPIAYVGDIIGNGIYKKSAIDNIIWNFGKKIPHNPNEKYGGYCFGTKINPLFFNNLKEKGVFPIEMDTKKLKTGDIIDIYPYEGITKEHNTNNIICKWRLQSNIIFDIIRAGGKSNLIIGKELTEKARISWTIGIGKSNFFYS